MPARGPPVPGSSSICARIALMSLSKSVVASELADQSGSPIALLLGEAGGPSLRRQAGARRFRSASKPAFRAPESNHLTEAVNDYRFLSISVVPACSASDNRLGASNDVHLAEEYESRSERLRQRMRQEGLDALIVFSDEYRSGHGTYLTGYKPINVIEESPQVVIYVGTSRRWSSWAA